MYPIVDHIAMVFACLYIRSKIVDGRRGGKSVQTGMELSAHCLHSLVSCCFPS